MAARSLTLGVVACLLVGCTGAKKPEISAINSALPFNRAMEAVIQQDEFLAEHLRPGFHRAADGSVESFTVSPDEEGAITIEHLLMLTKNWCTQKGGVVRAFSEIPVLQRGVGNVVRRWENTPVVGKAYNLVCYKGEEALAAAALGRATYLLNHVQFREATKQAGAYVNMRPAL